MQKSNVGKNIKSIDSPATVRTVLLVEEDDKVRFFAATVLTRCGYVVLEADSACAALKIWETHAPQIELLFTDVGMNGMDGTRLAELLLARNPKLRVLLSSGAYSETVRVMVGSRQSTGFLPKPYSTDQLEKTVSSAFRDFAIKN